MNVQLIDFQTAENDFLACATYLAQKIRSSDGHAEAVKELVPYYLEKKDVDLAAQLADSVEDTFVRDKLLTAVAEKCAAIDDDDYAIQLADAIEDVGLRSMAFERVAIQKALKNEYEKAFKYIENLSHPSDAMAAIAVSQALNEDETGALNTIVGIEFPASKINALQEIAEIKIQKGDMAKATDYLNQAHDETAEIDFIEERVRTLISIANHFIELGRKDRAIEILANAGTIAETVQGFNRENFLANISVGLLRAGSIDLADRTLDQVSNKTLLASALTSFSVEFDKNGEREEALETLEEAYAILKSERENEVRDSRARFAVLSTIAVNFSSFNEPERAIEIAIENPFEDERHSALRQIAQVCAAGNEDEFAAQAVNAIDEDSEKIFGLIAISEAKLKSGDKEGAQHYLSEAYNHSGDIKQIFLRSTVLNWLTVKFHEQDEKIRAQEMLLENLQTISYILDDSHKAIALAHLAKVHENLKFELNPKEKEIMNIMLRKSEW